MWDTLLLFSCACEDSISLPASEIAEQEYPLRAVQREVDNVFKKNFVIYSIKCLGKIDRHITVLCCGFCLFSPSDMWVEIS